MSVTERRYGAKQTAGDRRCGDTDRIADSLRMRGRVLLKVYGSSMQPWVRPKDITLIRQISMESVLCGDVVLFRREHHLFVHRIVEKRGSLNAARIFSKGDAHPVSDGVVQEKELLGRVARIYRGGRRIDLDSPRQLALAVFISQLSRHSRFWYPLARFAATVTRPVRRLINALHVSGVAAR